MIRRWQPSGRSKCQCPGHTPAGHDRENHVFPKHFHDTHGRLTPAKSFQNPIENRLRRPAFDKNYPNTPKSFAFQNFAKQNLTVGDLPHRSPWATKTDDVAEYWPTLREVSERHSGGTVLSPGIPIILPLTPFGI
jgi:hypothetical protein